jgi:hypothetical protein
MARFALALVAIVILILSARLTHGQPQSIPLHAGTTSAAALRDNVDMFRAELMLIRHATPAQAAQHSPNEEPPAPALLVYLALILVGGASSVALARWRLHGDGES